MNISVVLLAGGESRRMGQDKAKLEFNGRPLWKRQLDLLHQLNPIEIFISARTDPPWRPDQASFVADEPPSRGPLSGLTAAMSAMTTSHLLALAIDMPFMTLSELEWLFGAKQNGCGILPKIGELAEPLTAIYPHECLPQLLAALRGDDYSLQCLTTELVKSGRLEVFEVAPARRALYRSINSPADLATFSDFEQAIPAAK